VPSGTDSSDSEDDRMRVHHMDPILQERNQLRNPVQPPEIVNNDPFDDSKWERYVAKDN